MAGNCITKALERWHEDGGYLVVRRSGYWGVPHVLTVTKEGLLHYEPGAPLANPVQALVGYDGVTWDRDLADAPPVPLRGIVFGSWILTVTATLWAVGRLWRRYRG
jgi:hypothetical protein